MSDLERSRRIAVQLSMHTNGHIESFNGRLRDECLNPSWFRNLFDARGRIASWRDDYNGTRPHSSLDYRTGRCISSMIRAMSLLCTHQRLQTATRQYQIGSMPGIARSYALAIKVDHFL
jgi:transposase InsO family protein